jgi:4-diphosphocytidyl-2-C-methyl-D-erythritol kinase
LEQAAVNDLESVTAGRFKEIEALKEGLLAEGAQIARMSGSGPTVWGLFSDESAANRACAVMKSQVPVALAVSTISRLKD